MRLFRDTVHAVNACDYTKAQLDAWAPGGDGFEQQLAAKLLGQYVLGVRKNGVLIGFGSLDDAGGFDMLYVHKDFQRQGVGRALVHALEQEAWSRGHCALAVYASITARPFFERMGYVWLSDNVVMRDGVELRNCRMEKVLCESAYMSTRPSAGASMAAGFMPFVADDSD